MKLFYKTRKTVLKLLIVYTFSSPWLKSVAWYPGQSTQFTIIDKRSKKIEKIFQDNFRFSGICKNPDLNSR